MPLTKIDIADSLHINMGIQKKESLDVVDCLLEIVKNELSSGSPVMISGFGKWTVKSKKQRRGRNPQTGEQITITARKVITFQSSSILREVVSGEKQK